MKIRIEDFVKTGEFGSVKMGMTKQEIIQVLGQPDSDNDCGKRGWILLYSWYEFFISRDNKLFAIQNDNYDPQKRLI